MVLQILSYTCLVTAIIILTLGLYVFYKIYTGSKSMFANLLMGFTIGLGLQNAATFVIFMFPTEYRTPDNFALPNFYAIATCIFFFFLLSLQTWIFGMKYLESAIICSLTQPLLSINTVRNLNWFVISVYTLFMLSFYVFIII